MRNRLVHSFVMLAIGTTLSVTIAAQGGPPPGAPPAGGQARPGGPGGPGRPCNPWGPIRPSGSDQEEGVVRDDIFSRKGIF